MKRAYLLIYGLLALLVFALVAGVVCIESYYRQQTINVYLESARLITRLVDNSHQKYSNEVLDKLRRLHPEIISGHDHHRDENILPNPATFSMELAQSVSNDQQRVWMYSNHPFPWRKNSSTPKNDIEKQALIELTKNPSGEFDRTIGDIFFYATPIRMSHQVCINCHNQHAYSQKKDWRIGDTRSVLALSHTIAYQREYSFYIAFIFLALLCFIALLLLIHKLKQLDIKTREVKLDSLTQIPNRAFVNEDIQGLFNSLTSQGIDYDGIAIMMLDIDNFKKINDRYGHNAGDECLKQIASVVNNIVRKGSDVIAAPNYAARWGGEEFMVILSGTSADNTIAVADRLRLEVNQHKLTDHHLSITVSIGACFIKNIFKPDFHRASAIADQALLRAKLNGKNCAIVDAYTTELATDYPEKNSTV